MITIALLGHDLHNDNLGVGALTVSQVAILREIATRRGLDLRIVVLNGGGERPACIAGPDVIDRQVRSLREPLKLFATLRAADLVIDISGGDSFADIYIRRRLGIIFLKKFIAHVLGRPMVMAPQTVGPFARGLWRRLARTTLNLSRIVATRDDKSTDFVRELCPGRAIVEASDVALKLPYTAPGARPAGPIRVGLNVSGLLMQGGYDGRGFGMKSDYPALIRSIVERFRDQPGGCELHLVAHVLPWREGGGAAEDDHAANLALAAVYPEAIVAPRFETPSEAKSYIAELDFFLGARMHACIAAFSTGVPVVPMAYSRKFAGLFGSLGYDRTVDCVTETNDEILAAIDESFAARDTLRAEIEQARAAGFARLAEYEKALEAVVVELADKKGAT